MALLEKYDYPGNVRELENAIEHAVTLSEGAIIGPADLPAAIRSPRLLPRTAASAGDADADGDWAVRASAAAETARDALSLDEVTREHVLRVLARHGGNATVAARQLGLSRTTLWRMLKRWGMPRAAGGA